MEKIDIALLLLRAWAGLVIIAHGINHGRNLSGTASWFESKGFKSAKINAFISSAAEIAIGIAMIAGLLTAPAAAGLVAIMVVAFWSIHRFAGFFNFHRPDEGYEYVATLSVLALAVAIIGPGAISIDAELGIADKLDGWVGAGIIGLGVLAAAGQLATFWRKPIEGEVTA
jgi:putative oxidoreductase